MGTTRKTAGKHPVSKVPLTWGKDRRIMAKGTESKQLIFKKLQEIYPNSFFEDEGKILRVPMIENGDIIEIKCQLTAAKNNLGSGSPSNAFTIPASEEIAGYMPEPAAAADVEITPEEKQRVADLLASLGL